MLALDLQMNSPIQNCRRHHHLAHDHSPIGHTPGLLHYPRRKVLLIEYGPSKGAIELFFHNRRDLVECQKPDKVKS